LTAITFRRCYHLAAGFWARRRRRSSYRHCAGPLHTVPAITVPSITMEGDANGAPHAPPAAYAAKFKGGYEHRTITGGIGHNLPQEAPREFAKAVLDLS
jgi:pimeloyl-ACP methyl ester carboxylesterase